MLVYSCYTQEDNGVRDNPWKKLLEASRQDNHTILGVTLQDNALQDIMKVLTRYR